MRGHLQDAQAETNASFEEFMAESTKAEWASAKRQLFDALLPRGAGSAAARLDGMSLSPSRPADAFSSPFRALPAGVDCVQLSFLDASMRIVRGCGAHRVSLEI